MKTNRILIGAMALCAVAAVSTEHKQQPTTAHQVVILQGQQFYWQFSQTDPTTGQTDSVKYQWGGIRVFNADSSTGAPEFVLPVGDYLGVSTNSMAQALATLLDQGFTIQHTDGLNVTLIK